MKYTYKSKECATPLKGLMPLHVKTAKVNGKDYIYFTSIGTESVFNVYNLTDDCLVNSFYLPYDNTVWMHVTTSDGFLYLQNGNHTYEYNPYDDVMTDLGSARDEKIAVFTMTVDDEDNIYLGTYPHAEVIKWSKKDRDFEILGVADAEAKYVRSLSFHNGKLYASTFGDGFVKFFTIDLSEPFKPAEHDMPYFKSCPKDDFVYYFTICFAGDIAVSYVKGTARNYYTFFDTLKEEFIDLDFSGNALGWHISPEKDNKCYFVADNTFHYIDIKTRTICDTGVSCDGNPLIGSGWIETEHGTELITMRKTDGAFLYFNPDKGTFRVVENKKSKKGKNAVYKMAFGDDGKIYMGGAMAQGGASYDPVTGEVSEFLLGQTEGACSYNGTVYFGVYPGGRIYEMNLKKHTAPQLLLTIGENQDRPFAMIGAEDKLFLGTVSDYGVMGGALTVFDLKSRKARVFREEFSENNVSCLCYKDGIIYGGTGIFGGLSCKASEEKAFIFSYDIKKECVTDKFYPELNGDKPDFISAVTVDKNGKLWALSDNVLFSFDMEKKRVTHTTLIGAPEYEKGRHYWRDCPIEQFSDGKFLIGKNGVCIFDPETSEFEKISDENMGLIYIVSKDDRIFYTEKHLIKELIAEKNK